MQGRLAGLLGKSSGYIESLPDGAKKTLEALKGVQVKQNELQNQYKRECLELEKKVSHPIRVPFFFALLCPSLSTVPAPLTVRIIPPLPSCTVGWLCLFIFPTSRLSIRNRDMIDANKWAFLDPLPYSECSAVIHLPRIRTLLVFAYP